MSLFRMAQSLTYGKKEKKCQTNINIQSNGKNNWN